MSGACIGDRFGDRYVVEAPIGAGGMGVVVRARDEKLERVVALKLLSPRMVGDDIARARLLREARAAGGLEHPGIVHVYDVGETPDGGAFVVMELVRGKQLSELLPGESLDIAERLRIVGEVAAALGHAHRAGFVHRDVKPDNVMIRDDGRAVVLDFGLARRVDVPASEESATVTHLTQEGTVAGTPGYMAPEQAAGEPVDERTDQFALGLVAYEALTGSTPWRGRNAAQIIAEVLTTTPEPPSQLSAELPRAVDAVVLRALARRPEDRHPDVESFARALAEAFALGEAATIDVRPSATRGQRADARDREVAGERRGEAASARARHTAEGHAVTPAAPRAARPLPITARRARLRALTAIVVAATAITVVWQRRELEAYLRIAEATVRGASQPRVASSSPSALTAPDAVLACPMFAATGTDELPGWIGAAAADMFCRRAMLMLGGHPKRIRIPAELLDLPETPTESFPKDAYDAPGARAQSLDNARKRATVVVDGVVEVQRDAMAVEAVLRSSDGAELGRGAGRAPGLLGAVRAAMAQLLEAKILPVASQFDPEVAQWSDVRDPGLGLALLDLGIVIENGSAGAECDALERMRGERSVMWPVTQKACALVRQRVAALPALPELDPSSPAALAWSALARKKLGTPPDAATVDALARHLATEPSEIGRAMLAAVSSNLVVDSAPERARELATAAVIAAPRVAGCWEALLDSAVERPGVATVMRAASSWTPGFSHHWNALARYDASDVDSRVRYQRLGYRITGRAPIYAITLADMLLDAGDREAARTLAAELGAERKAEPGAAAGAGELIRARVEAYEGRLDEALARTLSFMQTWPEYGWATTGDTMITLVGREVSWILGREHEYADAFVRRYVEPTPMRIVAGDGVALMPVAVTCAMASAPLARLCVERLRADLSSGRHHGHMDIQPLLDGVVPYAEGRFEDAAKAWRPIVRQSGVLLSRAAIVVSDALDRAGDHELAAEVDAPILARAGLYAGASPADVRAARRAHALRRFADARKYAQKVIAAWGAQREPPPAVKEMRELLAKLPAQ